MVEQVVLNLRHWSKSQVEQTIRERTMTFVKGPGYEESIKLWNRRIALNKREVIQVDFKAKRIIKTQKENYD